MKVGVEELNVSTDQWVVIQNETRPDPKVMHPGGRDSKGTKGST